MTKARPAQRIEWIAISQITVVNPRHREKKVFKEIVDNIAQIGLKRPITVTRRMEADGPFYDLVCGQGRLEAYQLLGQHEVPAIVVAADPEDCLIASLVENCARRHHNALDLLQDIGGMRQRGYSVPDIARKTGLSFDYVLGVSRLIEQGEQKLLSAVEAGVLPISVATQIAHSPDHDVQRALQEAYDQGLLRGKRLLAAKKVIERRRRTGKRINHQKRPSTEPLTGAKLIKAYEEDATRKKDLIRRADHTRSALLTIVEAMRRLLKDAAFVSLLEEEGLTTMPQPIAARLAPSGSA